MFMLLSLACSPEYRLREGFLREGDVFETVSTSTDSLSGMQTVEEERAPLTLTKRGNRMERKEAQAGPQLLTTIQEDRDTWVHQWGEAEPEEETHYSHLEGEELLSYWDAAGQFQTRLLDPDPSHIKLEALEERLSTMVADDQVPPHAVALGESWTKNTAYVSNSLHGFRVLEGSETQFTFVELRRQGGAQFAVFGYSMHLCGTDDRAHQVCIDGEGEEIRDLNRDFTVSDTFEGSVELTDSDGEHFTGSTSWSTQSKLVAEGHDSP